MSRSPSAPVSRLAATTLLALAGVAAAPQVQAGELTFSPLQADIVSKFDTLVTPDASSDYGFDRSTLVIDDEASRLSSRVFVADAQAMQGQGDLNDVRFRELTLDVQSGASRSDLVVDSLFDRHAGFVPYFCHRFVGLAGVFDDVGACKAHVRDLISGIDLDPAVQVFLSEVDADLYGANDFVTLYVGRYESMNGVDEAVGQYLTLRFDLVHEI